MTTEKKNILFDESDWHEESGRAMRKMKTNKIFVFFLHIHINANFALTGEDEEIMEHKKHTNRKQCANETATQDVSE